MSESITTYGLIGFPVEHSLSPVMHNTAFRALDVQAEYKLFPLRPEEVEPFVRELKREDSPIFGVNVTVPYKETVIPFLDALSPLAKKIGAVNTIVRDDENHKLIGHNTDGPGFLAHLAELNVAFAGKQVAVLGAGGASRALISVLCLGEIKPAAIHVYDIDWEKSEALLRDLGGRFDVGRVQVAQSIDDLHIDEAGLLVNATPLGLKSDDPVLVDDSLLHPGLFVYDLIYNPAETPLLKMARKNGCRVSNGLGMLLYQGILAFQHWAKTELSETVKTQMRMSLEIGETI
ncbi:MAG: shikimate dehydrogenase [Candidatus Omnitrophota bacterium]